jgi:hypothetical protein
LSFLLENINNEEVRLRKSTEVYEMFCNLFLKTKEEIIYKDTIDKLDLTDKFEEESKMVSILIKDNEK